MRRAVSVIAAAVVSLSGFAPSAGAATVRGQWGMHPVRGVVADRTGRANLTMAGSWKDVPGAVGRAVHFQWNGHPSLASATKATAFNPGRAQFAIAAYIKTPGVPAHRGYSPNVVQKGLFGDRGQWKLELIHRTSGAVARCRFAGTRGHDMVVDHSATGLNDGRWHTVICWRGTSVYGISVDGVRTSVRGILGSIVNSRPLRVAAKARHAGLADQFLGTVDCVTYVRGSRPLQLARAKARC
jgi:hypothetical protein